MRELVGRDGVDRWRFMGARSGIAGMHTLPTWAIRPVRASNDADKLHHNPEIAVDMATPDELSWVARLASMHRQPPSGQ